MVPKVGIGWSCLDNNNDCVTDNRLPPVRALCQPTTEPGSKGQWEGTLVPIRDGVATILHTGSDRLSYHGNSFATERCVWMSDAPPLGNGLSSRSVSWHHGDSQQVATSCNSLSWSNPEACLRSLQVQALLEVKTGCESAYPGSG